MALPITEELVKELGFVQQNPPYIWDYPLNGQFHYGEKTCRLVKSKYGEVDQWTFQYGKANPVMVMDVMAMIRVVALVAYNQGVEDTQNKIYDGLGLHRLVEDVVAQMNRDD